MLLWISVYKYLFKTLLLILLDTYSEVESCDQMLILFLIFWGTTTLFPTVAAPLYIPTISEEAFQFLHIIANTCYYYFLIVAILMGMQLDTALLILPFLLKSS